MQLEGLSLNSLYSLLDNNYLKAYVIFTIVLVELSISRINRFQPKTDKERARDEKFGAFRMDPISTQSRLGFYIFAPFSIFKYMMGWGAALTNGAFLTVLQFFHNPNKPYNWFEQLLIDWSTWLTAKVVLMSVNCYSINTTRPSISYEEYLGKDWELTYEAPGSIVSNHSGWMDIIVHMTRQPPSHVSKKSI